MHLQIFVFLPSCVQISIENALFSCLISIICTPIVPDSQVRGAVFIAMSIFEVLPRLQTVFFLPLILPVALLSKFSVVCTGIS